MPQRTAADGGPTNNTNNTNTGDNSDTGDDRGAAAPVAATRWRDPLVVIGPRWLAGFAPTSGADADGSHPGGAALGASDGRPDRHRLVARLPLVESAGPARVVRLVHEELRRAALSTSGLMGFQSDGEAVAAVVGVTEASSRLLDDGGSAPAVARLALALGLASAEAWPAGAGARVHVLLAALHAAGLHPDAPVHTARLAAWSLALNAEADLPVPFSRAEHRYFGRLAGLGAGHPASGTDPDEGWPALLSPEETARLPRQEPVRLLFQRAALALRRLDAEEATATATTTTTTTTTTTPATGEGEAT